MPTVFIRDHPYARVFHKTKDCGMLRKKPARGPGKPLLEVELADLSRPTPCSYCYPDAPRARSRKIFCKLCNTKKAMPCPHNGGVLVHRAEKRKTETLYHDVGETVVKAVYVWPEAVRHYISS